MSIVVSKTKLALDSCVLISILGNNEGIVEKIKNTFDRQYTTAILYDVVLDEIAQKGKTDQIIKRISELLDFEMEVHHITDAEKETAVKLSVDNNISHSGDDMILAMSKSRDTILVTVDKALIRACYLLGVKFFNPKYGDWFSVNSDAYDKTIDCILRKHYPIIQTMSRRQLKYELEQLLPKYRFHKNKSVMYYSKIESIMERIEKMLQD